MGNESANKEKGVDMLMHVSVSILLVVTDPRVLLESPNLRIFLMVVLTLLILILYNRSR